MAQNVGNIVVSFVVLAFTVRFSQSDCIPDKTKFYWKSPCDNQVFTNSITLSNLIATQNGQDVDLPGGLDFGTPLKLVSTIVDNYGTINKPLIDVGMFQYAKSLLGKCQWKALPTFGLLDNKNSCDIVDNCHLLNNPTNLTSIVNFKDLGGVLIAAIKPGTYYGFTMTFKDDQKPLLCVYSQSKVIKK